MRKDLILSLYAISCYATLLLLGCGSISHPPSAASPSQLPPSVSIGAPAESVLAGTNIALTASVIGSSNQTIEWAVNGTVGGTSSDGTITPSGVYSAPANTGALVNISAILQENPAVKGSLQLQVVAPTSSPGQIGFAFSLPNSTRVSAGVYDSQGTLLRTLWSNQSYSAGPHVETWDGKDDYGNPLTAGSYQVRLLYNNVSYDWGVIGNTSASWQGPNNWDRQSLLPMDMAVYGTTAIVASPYAEGSPNASYFDLSQPQQPAPLITIGQCDTLQYVATDGKRLYFGNAGDGWTGSSAFVISLDATSHDQYEFPAGVSASNCGNSLEGVIDMVPNAPNNPGSARTNVPTGIAVQTNGNLLAVSHGTNMQPTNPAQSPSQDIIKLFDKTSGAQLGTISIANPQRIAFAPDGDLWAISGTSVVLISDVGRQNIVATTLQGLFMPLAIAVDPSTSDVLVADGGEAQQVKRFSAQGQLLSTYGDLGGYSDCNPTVTKSRLYLDTTAGAGYAAGSGYYTGVALAVQPDSSFWIGDPGNARVLHISFQGQYLEQISFLRYLYSITVDHSNPSRVFADTLEYAVDYTKPLIPGDPDPDLGGDGSWSLVRNWSVCVPSEYSQSFHKVQTFANGRTYAIIPKSNPTQLMSNASVLTELVELPASGPLRFSGQLLQDQQWFESFDHEGNLTYWEINQTDGVQMQTGYQQDLVGYDSNAFPIWNTPYVVASVPGSQSTDPVGWSGWGMESFPDITTGGIYVTYDAGVSTPGIDHHIGGVKAGGRDWSWKASPGEMIAAPDGEGTFPDAASFGGHNGISALVEGSNIFEGYDGQYGSFSSQWMHWSEDGLLIGQFGHPSNGLAADGTLFPGAAGNIATMATVTDGGNIYLYNSDEGYHPGIHRWTISGLGSLHEVTGSALLGGVVNLQ